MIFIIRGRIDPRTSQAWRCRKEFSIFRNFHFNKWIIIILRKSWFFMENHTGQKQILIFSDYISTLSQQKPIEFGEIEKTEQSSAVCSKMYPSGFSIWLILFAHQRKKKKVQVPNSRNRPFTVLGEFSELFRLERLLCTMSGKVYIFPIIFSAKYFGLREIYICYS